MNFSIRVVDRNGSGKKGVRVTVHFGLLAGHTETFTDSSGWAYISTTGKHPSGEIYVSGSSRGKHSLRDGATFSFSV